MKIMDPYLLAVRADNKFRPLFRRSEGSLGPAPGGGGACLPHTAPGVMCGNLDVAAYAASGLSKALQQITRGDVVLVHLYTEPAPS